VLHQLHDLLHAQGLQWVWAVNEGFNLKRFEISEVDGVAVIDVYGGSGSLDGLTRWFYLSREGAEAQYTLSCMAETADTARTASAMRIAQSLRITERSEAP
jgi:hypothetical protein